MTNSLFLLIPLVLYNRLFLLFYKYKGNQGNCINLKYPENDSILKLIWALIRYMRLMEVLNQHSDDFQLLVFFHNFNS